MAKKHQIWSSNKKTRVKAGRKWRRQAKEQLKRLNVKKKKRLCSSVGRARKDVFPPLVVMNEYPGEDYMHSKHEVASSNLAAGSNLITPMDVMRFLVGAIE